MNSQLLTIRYYLEIIAVPIFAYLVVHLGGHGLMSLVEEDHSHAEHADELDHGFSIQEFLSSILTEEFLGGLLLLIIFTWVWRQPKFKQLTPCSHDYCSRENSLPHLLAIIALCLHFFPEAGVRHELIENALEGEISGTLGLIGFVAHFLVDIIVAIILSSYWKHSQQFWISLISITIMWVVALLVAENILEHLPPLAESLVFLVSAFLLCMFVHKPHKPHAHTHSHEENMP